MYLPNLTHQFPAFSPAWVERSIDRWTRGRVKYQASYWPAELALSIANVTLRPNQAVQVCGRRSIVLLMAPLKKHC